MHPSLVIRAQHGDEMAFASLAAAIADRLQAIAFRILRDREVAEEAVQDALVRIWQDLPTLRDPARFNAWTYRVLVRSCYAEVRRSRHTIRNLAWDVVREPSIGDDTARLVARDRLERAFVRLSVNHRAVVVLHHYLGLPLAEVADSLGVPLGTVRSRLLHALRGLRAAIEADERETEGHAAGREAAR